MPVAYLGSTEERILDDSLQVMVQLVGEELSAGACGEDQVVKQKGQHGQALKLGRG